MCSHTDISLNWVAPRSGHQTLLEGFTLFIPEEM
jgi:hypothetical protein